MATFVLIHCGFAGGWTWQAVAAQLRQTGHDVHTPTLTGLGERAHLAHPDVDLDTHIQDIVGLIECEELDDIVLVGSSSGSMAMTGAAHRMAERIRELIYIDTLVPEDGQSWMDLMGPNVAPILLDVAEKYGDGWRVLRMDVQPPRWVAQPLRSVTQPFRGSNPAVQALPHTYIYCTAKPEGWFFGLGDVIALAAEQYRQRGWRFREMATDHLPMLSAPQELAALLDEMVS